MDYIVKMNWGIEAREYTNINDELKAVKSEKDMAAWLPGNEMNDMIKKENGIMTNYQYRQYLINNADEIIKKDNELACQQCCECPAIYKEADRTVLERDTLYKPCVKGDVLSEYGVSDMKNEYMSMYEIESRKKALVISQFSFMQPHLQKY